MNAAGKKKTRKRKLRLLIVDDRRLVCEGLAALFAAAGGVETAIADSAGTDWSLDRFSPEVVLICQGSSDGRPAEGGCPAEVARAILQRCPAARVVLLDEEVCPAHVCAAVTIGASGYWTMRASFGELVAAVRRVASGGLSFCPASQKHVARLTGPSQSDPPAPSSGKGAAGLSALSRRECDVLVLLARGLSVKQCARQLGLAASTIGNHKAQIMKKLGLHKIAELVLLAVREGLTERMNDEL